MNGVIDEQMGTRHAWLAALPLPPRQLMCRPIWPPCECVGCVLFLCVLFVDAQWENGQRGNSVAYTFPNYNQTEAFHDDAMFAINTALNFII